MTRYLSANRSKNPRWILDGFVGKSRLRAGIRGCMAVLRFKSLARDASRSNA